ncbi:MAG: LON peptidase substrate-binding domain-containing protein [bacterium]
MTADQSVEIPLFPLRSVLFPGGVLPLRIFEPRYVDMVSRCMREGIGFGVVLIRHGTEARLAGDAEQPDIFHIGTEAEIVDFNQADNGLLGIVTRGRRKFMVLESHETADHLLMARVEFLAEEAPGELLPEHDALVGVLKELIQHPLVQKLNIEVDFTQARSVSLRLAELLPIEPEIKQAMLQMRWPKERLAELSRIVGKFQG